MEDSTRHRRFYHQDSQQKHHHHHNRTTGEMTMPIKTEKQTSILEYYVACQNCGAPMTLRCMLGQIYVWKYNKHGFSTWDAAQTSCQRCKTSILTRTERARPRPVMHSPEDCTHNWRFGRSEKAQLRARECMNCDITEVLLTEGSTKYARVPVTVRPVPEWLEANPHWRKHWRE